MATFNSHVKNNVKLPFYTWHHLMLLRHEDEMFLLPLLQSKKITEHQLEEIRESFAIFDKNGDGSISCEEIGDVMRSLGQTPTDKQLKEMMMQVDEDGNGEIDFQEFVQMMIERYEVINKQERDLKRVFAVFDKDGNGYIEAIELKRVMNALGEDLTDSEIDEMIREADGDGDGRVDYSEFVRIMCGGGSSSGTKSN